MVMGTGNHDEDGYLGYFCKAGDGVVDVQLIADLHKSEVFKVGAVLGVPQSILSSPPSADLWEGQTDEDELGVTYDFVVVHGLVPEAVEGGASIVCGEDGQGDAGGVGAFVIHLRTSASSECSQVDGSCESKCTLACLLANQTCSVTRYLLDIIQQTLRNTPISTSYWKER